MIISVEAKGMTIKAQRMKEAIKEQKPDGTKRKQRLK